MFVPKKVKQQRINKNKQTADSRVDHYLLVSHLIITWETSTDHYLNDMSIKWLTFWNKSLLLLTDYKENSKSLSISRTKGIISINTKTCKYRVLNILVWINWFLAQCLSGSELISICHTTGRWNFRTDCQFPQVITPLHQSENINEGKLCTASRLQ